VNLSQDSDAVLPSNIASLVSRSVLRCVPAYRWPTAALACGQVIDKWLTQLSVREAGKKAQSLAVQRSPR
jgi:hypothetical protein